MPPFIAFASGLLFAIGLGVSGMTQPSRVTSFLDFTGEWNGSLAFVMLGAITVYAIGYRWIMRRRKPLMENKFYVPEPGKIDRSLVLGAALFGIGWGMAGFCPGPAIASIVSLQREPLLFVLSMLVGMGVFEWTQRNRKEI